MARFCSAFYAADRRCRSALKNSFPNQSRWHLADNVESTSRRAGAAGQTFWKRRCFPGETSHLSGLYISAAPSKKQRRNRRKGQELGCKESKNYSAHGMANKRKTRKPAVQIEVRESGVHGRGVYTIQFIRKGTRIIEYAGERVPWERAPDNADNPHTFNFGLENGDVINPEIGGNDARWINHSCNPNCEAVEEDDRIFIYAMRNIEAGEELLYDYQMQIDEPITDAAKKKFACHCGASNCRGTMLELKEAVG